MGSYAVEGPVLDWVADHRKHHTFADEEGDPHSPHVGQGAGFAGAARGLWHAHVGWLFETNGQAEKRRYCPDLAGDPVMRRINRGFPLIVLATLAIPFLAGLRLGRHAERRARGAPVGRAGAHLPRAPHHVEHQLDLPLHRRTPLRDR